MDKNKGWIKLYRGIMDHWVYTNNDMQHYWIDLLLLANHKTTQTSVFKRLVTIKAGQHLTSQRKLGERWGMDVKTVKKVLDTFEEDGMITVESKYNGTLITVVNYGVYQGFEKGSSHTDSHTDSIPLSHTDSLPDSHSESHSLSLSESLSESHSDSHSDSLQTRKTKMTKNDIENDSKNSKNEAPQILSVWGMPPE